MPHDTPLITTIVAGLVLAFLLGAIANRLRLSPLDGYLLAGVLIGPGTPGFVADTELAPELAEIGVVLLMFGVGLHFSLRDLLSVKAIAVPGALAQIALATALGYALGRFLGWEPTGSLVFGLALSVASTVVLLRALEERRLVETVRGRIAVGWLIVEDLGMVATLVLLPAIVAALEGSEAGGGFGNLLAPLAATLAKVAVFIALMLIIGRRLLPWALHRIAGTGSSELFTLAVLAISLGIAFGSAELFGVSFALGAFFAGMVLAESELSHRAAEDSLPLRDAFAVLFFVSVGMLFDPAVLVERPLQVLATVLIIVLGKSVAAYGIVRAFGHSNLRALTISASLAQIGEFSFILAALGVGLGVMVPEAQDLVLAGAIGSILVNPLLFTLLDRIEARQPQPAPQQPQAVERMQSHLVGHAVVVGYGTVGRVLAETLRASDHVFLVIDDRNQTAKLRDEGIETVIGNAADTAVLEAANVARAAWLFVAIPNVFEAGQVIEKARSVNPRIRVAARAETEAERAHLLDVGADEVIVGRREIALAMIAEALGDGPRATAAAS
jgi:CPA2 family monovalent cation:H+ antiporter-2